MQLLLGPTKKRFAPLPESRGCFLHLCPQHCYGRPLGRLIPSALDGFYETRHLDPEVLKFKLGLPGWSFLLCKEGEMIRGRRRESLQEVRLEEEIPFRITKGTIQPHHSWIVSLVELGVFAVMECNLQQLRNINCSPEFAY